MSNDSYVATMDSVDRSVCALWCFVISRDYDGNPLVSYGFETDARIVRAAAVDSVLARTPLLPPSLLHGVPRDSVVSIKAWAPNTGAVYTSSVQTFNGEFHGRRHARRAIQPDAACGIAAPRHRARSSSSADFRARASRF